MDMVGGYRLVRRLGSGGMGAVHEALDADGRRVAIKVLHPAIGADPSARERLRREVALLHRVRGAGVARVLDAEVDGPDAFVVTELIDGPSLDEAVRTGGVYEGAELAELAHGLAEGLEGIHRAGVTHRDLKPGNIMISAQGPVIIDFGIAQIADDARLTQTGMVTGTPGYLDPEVLAGADPGPVGDWWAWAAVLTFAASGRPPFGRGPLQAVLGRVTAGEPDTDGLDPLVARVLRAALDPDPGLRPEPGVALRVLEGQWGEAELTAALPEPGPEAGDDGYALPSGTRVMPPSIPPYSPPGAASDPATSVFPAVPPEEGYPVSYPGADEPVRQPYAQGQFHPEGDVGQAWAPYPPSAQPPTPSWALEPRARPLSTFALAAGLAVVAAWWPGVWLIVLAAGFAVFGTLGRVLARRRRARLRRGVRGGDTARAAFGAPWYLVQTLLAMLPAFGVAAALAAGCWLVAVSAAGLPEAPVLASVALLAGVTAWVVPTSDPVQEGVRATLAGIGRVGRVLVLFAATIAVLALLSLLTSGGTIDPVWDPFGPPPEL